MSGLFDVVTVGSNTLDVFVTTDTELVQVSIHDNEKKNSPKKKRECLVYPLGEKILVKELSFEIGGGGTNTAVSFSRLGFKTGYLGKIGHDESGVQVFNLLHREKIEFIGEFGGQTGYSVILDSKETDDRTILAFKGCNDDFKYSFKKIKRINTKWFYFSSMAHSSLKVLDELAQFASKKGIKIAFNPSSYLVVNGLKPLKNILQNTNVLILNKEEAELLSGEQNLNKVLSFLKSKVKDYVVVTDGKNGCWCFDGKEIIHAKPRKDVVAVETTGAGDAFASGFTAGLIRGKSVSDSVRMGMIQSESVIAHKGAKNILLSKSVMIKKLNNDKRSISKIKFEG